MHVFSFFVQKCSSLWCESETYVSFSFWFFIFFQQLRKRDSNRDSICKENCTMLLSYKVFDAFFVT